MEIYGHRGAAGHAPENTLPSIRTALAMNVDGIEFDVRATRDGVPLLLHDATLDRTTQGSGLLKEMSFAELRAALPGQPESVPLLEEVLEEIGRAAKINVELKERQVVEPAVEVLRAAIEHEWIQPDAIVVSSFRLDAVTAAKQRAPEFPIAVLTHGIPEPEYWETAAQLGAVFANIDLASVNADFVNTAHGRGLRVMVYTVNDAENASRMRALGVDAIFSDYPDRVRLVAGDS